MTAQAPETTYTAEPGALDASYTAVIDAPPEVVWRAYVEPELLARWWAPPHFEVQIERYEPEPGGSWRFLNIDGDGNEYAFHGVIHDVVPNRRIVQTFEFEGLPGHVCLQTATLEPHGDGATKVTGQAVFQSVEDRDGMSESGMRDSVPVIMNSLAEVVEDL